MDTADLETSDCPLTLDSNGTKPRLGRGRQPIPDSRRKDAAHRAQPRTETHLQPLQLSTGPGKRLFQEEARGHSQTSTSRQRTRKRGATS